VRDRLQLLALNAAMRGVGFFIPCVVNNAAQVSRRTTSIRRRLPYLVRCDAPGAFELDYADFMLRATIAALGRLGEESLSVAEQVAAPA
jgi:hypothetical protein